MMLGYLLGRAGVDTIVLEKHADFFRDFRGDTVHPSTLQVMDELGLIDGFLKLPHQQLQKMDGKFGDTSIRIADLSRLKAKYPFIAFMPQWDFLNFLRESGKRFPVLKVMMNTEVTDLIGAPDAVAGVKAVTPEGPVEIRADLTIGCDGRHSIVRQRAGLAVEEIGAPIDVLWFRVTRDPASLDDTLARVAPGHFVVTIDRGDYWQCASIIRKGSFEAVKAAGLDAFRARVAGLAHRESADEIQSWDDVKLLTVRVDRLARWYRAGLLFIGDAAHAMSPVGGVGINLAIQDAVAAANRLAAPLLRARLRKRDLAAVQRRRRFPTWATQKMQVTAQNNVIDPLLRSAATPKVPGILKLAQRLTFLQRIPARIIGMGFRPEHVKTKEAGR